MSDLNDIKAISEAYIGMLSERKKMQMDDAITDVLDNEKIGKKLDKSKRPTPQQMVQLIDMVAKKMALNPRSLDSDKEDEIREKILLYMDINEQLDENKNLMKDYQDLKDKGKKDSAAIEILMGMPKYRKMSRDQISKIIGDQKRKGVFKR